jgi:hypothetical protein
MADKLFRDYYNEKVTAASIPVAAKIMVQEGASEPKKLDVSVFATAAQGTKADSALPSTATAVNSDELGGQPSTFYAQKDEVYQFLYNDFKVPANRSVTPPFGGDISGGWFSEFENYFNDVYRPLKNVVIGCDESGVIGVALFTISGTSSTLFSEKLLNVNAGVNTFTLSEISNITPLSDVNYFIFLKKSSGDCVTFVSNNPSKGLTIMLSNITRVLTSNFSFSFFLTIRQEVFTSYVDFDVVKEIKNKDNVFIPAGIWTANEKITLREGQSITGIRGQSFIKFNPSINSHNDCIEINGISDVSLRNFTILGSDANTPMSGNDVAAGLVDNISEAIGLTNIGSNNGIVINACPNLTIENVKISNLNGKGIEAQNFGNQYRKSSKFSNFTVENCFVGVYFKNKSEYNTISGLHSNNNQIGLIIDAGNNSFTNCNVSGNRVNVMILGGVNNAHGNITGGVFNHGSLHAFIIDNVTLGEMITGVNIWYASIYVRNSTGIVFNGCQIANTQIFADGNVASGGVWTVCNSMVKLLTINHNYLGNTSNLKLKNNLQMNGVVNPLINN